MRISAALARGTDAGQTTELDTDADSGEGTRRQWLTEGEVEAIIRSAASTRAQLMILIAYRLGLRVSELINLGWAQIDLDAGRVSVRRLKNGEDSVHPLSGREIRGLRALRRKNPGARYVFITERGAPMTRNAFHKLLVKAATKAGLNDVHPHLLRHACGFKLVNQGFDTLSLAAYLGHRQVANTKRYCRMDSRRFEGLWRD